jgi:hypothetical protein
MRGLPDPTELQSLLKKPPAPYKAFKKQAESAVARWEWASGELYSLRPWYHVIHDVPRGRRLAAPPARKVDIYKFGFDAADRLAVVWEYVGYPGKYCDHFLVRKGDEILEYQYSFARDFKAAPEHVARYRFAGDRLLSYERLGKGRSTTEAYEYDGDRLVRIHCAVGLDGGKRTVTRAYDFAYSSNGEVARIEQDDHTVVYQGARPKPPKLSALLDAMRQALVKRIPAAVRSFKLTEPAFCLALAYDGEAYEGMLPPTITLGLQSERRAWEAAGTKKVLRELLWDPQTFRTFDADGLNYCDDRVLRIAEGIVAQLKSSGDSEPARTLLVAACRELNKLKWQTLTAVTDDFVVYPVDLECADLVRNMQAVLGDKAVRALQARRLLPKTR